MDTVLTCPFGHICETLKRGKLHRCRAYIEIEGAHPQTGEVVRERKCSILEWQPILLLELARTGRSQSAATEGLRNAVLGTARLALIGGNHTRNVPHLMAGEEN